MSLRELYQEMIIDHGRTPRNFGKLSTANHRQVGHNPLCGDRLIVYVETNNEVIKNIRFEGCGCAISMASASLMTECLQGKPLSELPVFFEKFHHLVTHGEKSQVNLGKLTVFSGVSEFPARVKCATLAWHTLKAALNSSDDTVSTE